MRKFFALTLMILSLTGFAAFADDSSLAEPGSLEYHMKEIGELFKGIGGSIKDTSKNMDNAKAAAQISALFKLTKEQPPDHVNEIPEAKRADALKDYQDMIQQCIDLADHLEQAFLNGDNAEANKIYRQMKDLKQDGHDQFDP